MSKVNPAPILCSKNILSKSWRKIRRNFFRSHIFSCVRSSYEQPVSDLDRSMHRSLWVWVTHSSFIEGSHTTKNMTSGNKWNSTEINDKWEFKWYSTVATRISRYWTKVNEIFYFVLVHFHSLYQLTILV